MGDLGLICVDPKRAAEFWPHVKWFIASAIERTELSSFEGVEAAILEGRQLLWIAWDGKTISAAGATELNKIGDKLICTITAWASLGHQRDRWLPLLEVVERYARAEGADAIRLYGRKGWERVLDGFKVEHVILEKALN